VLLATENAPPGKKAFWGMFPQLGAPLGFLCSSITFLLLTTVLTEDQLLAGGWRIPFLASALLVFVGLYVRLRLVETPEFQRAVEQNERVRVPMRAVIVNHTGALILGTFAAVATFLHFYLMTVFSLSWATTALKIPRPQFLVLQMIGVLFFALTIPLSAMIADRRTRKGMLVFATLGVVGFGTVMAPLFGSGTTFGSLVFLGLGFGVVGFTYGPLGTLLAEMFPTAVRYTGASLAFNLAGIVGAAPAPAIATYLAKTYGLAYVGYYLSLVGLVTLLALALIREKRIGAPSSSDPLEPA
jgi:MFS family permease